MGGYISRRRPARRRHAGVAAELRLDADQQVALRRLQAAFGEVEVLDHHPNGTPSGGLAVRPTSMAVAGGGVVQPELGQQLYQELGIQRTYDPHSRIVVVQADFGRPLERVGGGT